MQEMDRRTTKGRDGALTTGVGLLLALAGVIVTAGAIYQMQKTGEERRALAAPTTHAPSRPAAPVTQQRSARMESERLAALATAEERAAAQRWRERVDRQMREDGQQPAGAEEVRCIDGVRLIKRGNAWTNQGRC